MRDARTQHTQHNNPSSPSTYPWGEGRLSMGQTFSVRGVNFPDARMRSKGHPSGTTRTDSDNTLFFKFLENFG